MGAGSIHPTQLLKPVFLSVNRKPQSKFQTNFFRACTFLAFSFIEYVDRRGRFQAPWRTKEGGKGFRPLGESMKWHFLVLILLELRYLIKSVQ